MAAVPDGHVVIPGCEGKADTGKAVLVEHDGATYWIPKKCIHDDSECYSARTSGTLVIPLWLAEEKGLPT